MLAVAKHNALVRQHACDRCHDTRTGEVLPEREGGLDHPDESENDCEGQVGNRWRISEGFPGDEDKNACHEEDRTEAAEEI